MKPWTRLCLAAVLVAPLAGCSIYFGDDDDDCVEVPPGDQGVRNPWNGVCEEFGGGGGCGVFAAEAPIAFDWGDCPSACEALDEQACLASPDCKATYVECGPNQDCLSHWNECWDLPPSGGNYGPMCEGLDAETCNRNADCASYYQRDPATGQLAFSGCHAEAPVQGCFSDEECPTGTTCTADTECLPPPGCMPGGACPDVCYGRCVPISTSCNVVDCVPGTHCVEECTACDPTQPMCEPTCTATCVPDGPQVCDNVTCPMGQHCEPLCHPCDPLPGQDCPPPTCEPMCVADPPPPTCNAVDCGPGAHCEIQCVADPAGTMVCGPVCVPDGNSCAGTVCAPGTHCVETCAPPPPGCMGGPIGCPPTCTIACVPNDPGTCHGPVLCDSLPPACPMGTLPGVRDGCWSGYCIPLAACESPPPAACETLATEAACQAQVGCEPVYTASCTLRPDGTWSCNGFAFNHCQSTAMPPPMPMPMP